MGLGLPAQCHSHAIEGERGQYLSHDAETGQFDREPSIEYVLGLTQFPSCDRRPSIDALCKTSRQTTGTYAHVHIQKKKRGRKGERGSLTSIFCGKIFHFSSFPCCVVK